MPWPGENHLNAPQSRFVLFHYLTYLRQPCTAYLTCTVNMTCFHYFSNHTIVWLNEGKGSLISAFPDTRLDLAMLSNSHASLRQLTRIFSCRKVQRGTERIFYRFKARSRVYSIGGSQGRV